jgi:hypothetical protein
VKHHPGTLLYMMIQNRGTPRLKFNVAVFLADATVFYCINFVIGW